MTHSLRITTLALCLVVVTTAHAERAIRQQDARSSAALAISATQGQNTESATGPKDDSSSAKEATGTVTELTCAGAIQRIDVKTSSETLHLRTSTGYRIHIEGSSPSGAASPCASLTGMRVLVQYAPDQGKEQSGVIGSLRPAIAEGEGLVSTSDGPLAVSAPVEAPSEPGTIQQLEPGSKMTEDGRVTEVTCYGNDMLIKLSSGGRRYQLHARDYSRLTYDDDRRTFENRDFQACTQLKGLRASVTFVIIEHKPYDGELQSAEIEK